MDLGFFQLAYQLELLHIIICLLDLIVDFLRFISLQLKRKKRFNVTSENCRMQVE